MNGDQEQPMSIHSMTVTTRIDDEGTEDERRVVDCVKFVCTAPEDADCRRYPNCDCESWSWNEAGTHDEGGHERVLGQECWIATWIYAGAGLYTGADADDMRGDGVPAIDRSGPITAWTTYDEYLEWNWDLESHWNDGHD